MDLLAVISRRPLSLSVQDSDRLLLMLIPSILLKYKGKMIIRLAILLRCSCLQKRDNSNLPHRIPKASSSK